MKKCLFLPAMDLPKALDAALKALLINHSISSFKVDDSRHSPAVIIRLSPLRVSSVCQDGVPAHVNTFRRKPPSQVKRDRERMDDFKHRSDRVEKQTVHVPEITTPIIGDVLSMCKDRCDESDEECTVQNKVSERDSHVDIESRSLDACSVARAEDTGVTLEGVTDGEVSRQAADAGSGTATLSTHSAAPATVAVSKKVTTRKEVASTTRADPGVMYREHEERREGRIEKDSGRGGQGVEQTISLEMCEDDSSEWVDIDRRWRDDKTWKKKKHVVNEIKEDVRRSRREGRGVRERDRGWDQNK